MKILKLICDCVRVMKKYEMYKCKDTKKTMYQGDSLSVVKLTLRYKKK